MSGPLLSPDWYRIAFLRPRLRSGLRVARHRVRGAVWHVVTDAVSGRHHRFNRMAWKLVAGCDGRRSFDEVWAALVEAHGDDAPTQGEAIEILRQAYAGHMLVGDVPPDAQAVVRLQSRARSRQRRAAVNPLAFRVRLWDPDAFLQRHVPRLSWAFGALALRVLSALALLSLLLLLVQAAEFAREAHPLLASTRGLLLLWLVYPVIKGLHELAHAFAVKHYGGEVRAMGITLLMLAPVPFVDASASVALPDKRQRALVAGAGIGVELLMAGAALVLWLLLEPGLARDVAACVVVVGGVSTLLVNGNPLLRFDGYHVLCDLAELPNLAQRSAGYWLHLLRRHLLGLSHSSFGGLARGERGWLAAYAPLSWLSRVLLMGLLVLALAEPAPWLALILALLAAWSTLVAPLGRALGWVLRAPQLQGRRSRALGVTLAGVTLAGVLAFVVPMPQRSQAPGLVWLPDDAIVRLGVSGFVDEFVVRDGERVEAGAPLVRLSNEPLEVALGKARAELYKEQVQRAQVLDRDPLAAAQGADRIARLEGSVHSLAAQREALVVHAATAGRVVFDVHRNLVGMHLPQGHLLAQVIPDAPPIVRALVSNEDIELVRQRPGLARVQFAHGGEQVSAAPRSEVPQASTALPSAALGAAAGGSIALDPADAHGRTAREPRFQVDLQLPPGAPAPIGARVMVTFEHGAASAAELLMRALRRSFLRHLQA